ncbi:MAG: hypothetical protein R6U98_30450 [Pirellulaceae bacterium]
MESCRAQSVLPLVGLTADTIARDRYIVMTNLATNACLSVASPANSSNHNYPVSRMHGTSDKRCPDSFAGNHFNRYNAPTSKSLSRNVGNLHPCYP